MIKIGLKGLAKATFFSVFLIIFSFFVYKAIPTFASPDAIWTTRNDCGNETQDVNHFSIGDHVYINGEGFNPEDYYWEIKGQPGSASCDPNIIVANGTYSVNSGGSFCFDAYTVQPDDCGEYQVKFGVKGDNYRVPDDTTTTTTTSTTTTSSTSTSSTSISTTSTTTTTTTVPVTTTTIPTTTSSTTTSTTTTSSTSTTTTSSTTSSTTTTTESTTTICKVPNPPIKKVGDPKIECQEYDWCDWRITMKTPITLTCENAQVKWRYALDGDWEEWHTDESPVTIYFPEESNHTLEVYCVNNCGESLRDLENFKVEGTKLVIPLKKKWNLISVPFTLLNNDPNEVFKDIKDEIDSVWAYDGEKKEWQVYTPNGDPDNLNGIVPGWGYWVLAKNDTMLVIGGSLFSPATTPPSRNLVEGWNLIGYYGTGLQEYLNGYDTCGVHYEDGNHAYCALNSLVDTHEGFPKWSSLVGYDNCGEHYTNWIMLNLCDSMYAGKGYWIEMDVGDIYAPATTCIWNGGQCV